MRSKKQNGFTIVELLVVIAIISVLSLIVGSSFHNTQKRSRNTAREANIDAMALALETLFTKNGSYPTRATFNFNRLDTTKNANLPPDAMIDPLDEANYSTPSSVQPLVATPAAQKYAYVPTAADGTTTACGATSSQPLCTKFTLTATYEGTYRGNTTFVKKSLH